MRKFNQIEADLCIVYRLQSASIKSDKNCDEELPEIIDTGKAQKFNKILHDKKILQNPDILFDIEKS